MNKIFEKIFIILNGDMDSLIEISEDFMLQMDQYILIMKRQASECDYENLKTTAHTLKGSVLNFNLPAVASELQNINDDASSMNCDNIKTSIEKIQLQMEIFKKEFIELKININIS